MISAYSLLVHAFHLRRNKRRSNVIRMANKTLEGEQAEGVNLSGSRADKSKGESGGAEGAEVMDMMLGGDKDEEMEMVSVLKRQGEKGEAEGTE